MGKMDITAYANELSEEYDYKISIAGRLGSPSKRAHKRRIRAMLDKVVENHIPENEEVREIDVLLSPWELPMTRVWCESKDFTHKNSEVHDETFMVNGSLFHCKVDVRPF